ncbi:MAG: hypothetical protein COB37_12040 [Kordiimonadales bacterium]|nr:MAG: hypothetical protein COB37_12040 [Kordiimonadales bacterium]
MTLLSLTGIESGPWITLLDGELPSEGDSIAVPIARLLEEGVSAFATAGALGAAVPTGTSFAELEEVVRSLTFVAIEFSAFGDGRGFSLAVRLRKDMGFKGEIRAVGPVMPDQAQFLLRSGFDSVEITDESRVGAFRVSLERFNEFYQTDYMGARSIAHARHGISQ